MKKKYLEIYENLVSLIVKGEYSPGDKLPPELELAKTYQASRPTINKALEKLNDNNFIVKKPKSGSYVFEKIEIHPEVIKLGLMIPLLGTREIFEPICARIAQLSNTYPFTLQWSGSHATKPETLLEELLLTCENYKSQGVSGVFFVPLEFAKNSREINSQILDSLKDANIDVVLLDADYQPFPERSNFDLVGVDNYRCGYIACSHYLDQKATRVDYVSPPNSAFTVDMRIQGYSSALIHAGIPSNQSWVHQGDPEDISFVKELVASGAQNFICSNDLTAVQLMLTLLKLGISIPGQARVIGFDDIRLMNYSNVPLTTFRQYCDDMGTLAVETMMMRLKDPNRRPVTILSKTEFLIRKSSIIPK